MRPKLRAHLSFLVALLASAYPTDSTADVLSEDERQLLAVMHDKTALEVLELASRVKEWQQDIAKLKAVVPQVDEAEFGINGDTRPNPLSHAVLGIANALEPVAKRSQHLDKFLRYSEKIAPILAKAEERVKSASFNAEMSFDIDETQYREEIRGLALAHAASELLTLFDTDTWKSVERLRNPAQFAKDFADREISQWLAEPRKAGGVTFKILKTEPSKSLFSPDADIVIQMEYGPGIVVEAHGLYFKYVDAAPHFEAVLDQEKMKLTTNLQALGQAQITKAANEVLATIDGPVTVKNFEFTDFGTSNAGLKCQVEVNLGEILPLKARGDVLLTTDGKLHWVKALNMTYQCTPPIPVGSTPLGIHEIRGQWDPEAKKAGGSNRQLTVQTIMSTVAAKTDDAVALEVSIAFDFPVKVIDIDGKVTLGHNSIGDVWGTLDLSRAEAEAEFKIPGDGSVIPKSVFAMTGKTKITREGLDSVGNARLFGKDVDKSHLFIGTDGHGRFTAESCQVCGVDVAPSLEVGFQPGFSEVWARAVFGTNVDLGLVSLLDVSVEVEANTKSEPSPVHVVANAWGERISFHLPTLTALDQAALLRAIQEHMPDLYDAMLEVMAHAEADARKALAKAEKDFKEEISRAVSSPGFAAVRTGNEDLDRTLGEISEAGKKAGGELAEQRKQIHETLTALGNNPGGTVADMTDTLVSNVSSALSNPLDTLSGALGGGGGGGGGSSGPSREAIEQQVREAKVEQGLREFREQLNRVAVTRATPPDFRIEGGNRYSDESQLRVQFRNAASDLLGKEGVTVALLVSTSGFRSTINTRKSNQLQAASDGRPAYVQIDGFVSDEKRRPRARIVVPKLKDASSFNAQRIAHYELQRLIELYLPDIDIQGPKTYVESQLAVYNLCKEPITVWVQGRWRKVDNAHFVWQWAPGNPGSREAYRFSIDPGETELLEIAARFPDPDSTLDNEARPLTASCVRLWAESESGERWMTHFDKDLWLVPPEPGMEETRGYFADQIRTYTHVIEPKSGTRIFDERLVVMTNKTREPLKVQLRYRATEGGETAWRTAHDLTIPPGGSEFPKTSEGMRVRASQVQFSARSDHLFFGAYSQNILPLVGGADGQRLYHADKIGQFEHVFESPVVKSQGSK